MNATRRDLARLFAAAGLVATLPGVALAQDGGLPNVFISPCGRPFRAAIGAPYPVADWFKAADKNADGKLDHAEFIADAAAFFDLLDISHDGILDPYEISMYEHRVAPEILYWSAQASLTPRLWLAQIDPETPVGQIDPGGGQPNEPAPKPHLEEGGVGASPFSLLPIPEPVTAGDADFLFDSAVRKPAFLRKADENFTALDDDNRGFLTLATLPKTPVQKLIEDARRHHR